jgi:hypothetical protein
MSDAAPKPVRSAVNAFALGMLRGLAGAAVIPREPDVLQPGGGAAPLPLILAVVAALILGVAGCVVGAIINPRGFCGAWLCAFLFWLGLPLCGVTLILTHDLTGGDWMATARPALRAAAATMPLATLAAIPAFFRLHSLFSWTHPAPSLTNTFYLNTDAFYLRYAIYVVLWNLLAAFALWAPRGARLPIAPGLSWLSGIGLALLALSAGFASVDWIESLQPAFWSSAFPYASSASWFNTGMAMVMLVIAVLSRPTGVRRDHLADLAAILLALVIFWAYIEFVQFLIIWEEDLKAEIPWYLTRLKGVWQAALYVSVGFGFVVPFFVLLWRPSKQSRAIVAAICVLVLLSRLADRWWLVIPQLHYPGPFWLDVAAVLALGGLVLLLFFAALGRRAVLLPLPAEADHG